MTAPQKPRVYLIGTGGSISFIGDHRTDYINYSYRNRHLTIEQMLANIPEAEEFAEALPEQLVNVGSANILPSHWLQLARRINEIFTQDPGGRRGCHNPWHGHFGGDGLFSELDGAGPAAGGGNRGDAAADRDGDGRRH